ncbi:AraC family transcriptional regulator [Bifidobacterium canis]|uniref:AraC family transcriptional regulator n=1 Tax=Bifidobacterium canis TaxID=2610880 RepID=UPI0012D97373
MPHRHGTGTITSYRYPDQKIAQQLGFSSERYFSDCFQRKCGTCPRKYRSTHIG